MTKVRPLQGTILITPVEQKSIGSIQVTNDKQEENQGIVVEIGTPRKEVVSGKEIVTFAPPEISVGDIIIYEPQYQKPLVIGENEYRFIQFEKVLGVVQEVTSE